MQKIRRYFDYLHAAFYNIIMTQQESPSNATLVLSHLHITSSSSSNSQTHMINYFEFELPNPEPSDDDLHLSNFVASRPPSSPHKQVQPSLPPRQPFLLDFTDTLESEVSPLSQSPSPLPALQESDSEKQQEGPERRSKNETKNIPKNFGKGIISFIEKNQRKVRALLRQERVTFSCFIEMMREEKKRVNTICDLRRLWTHQVYGKCLRIISNLFLRRHALHYIFNSRISNYGSHIKYRQSLWKALRNPQEFNHIKEF